MWSVKVLPNPGLASDRLPLVDRQRVLTLGDGERQCCRRHGSSLTIAGGEQSERYRAGAHPCPGGAGRCGPADACARAAQPAVGAGRRVRRVPRRRPRSAVVVRTASPRAARSAATAGLDAGRLVGASEVLGASGRPTGSWRSGRPCPGRRCREPSRAPARTCSASVRSGLMLPLAASPMPPATAAAMSVMMSPKRLSVTMTSNRAGVGDEEDRGRVDVLVVGGHVGELDARPRSTVRRQR